MSLPPELDHEEPDFGSIVEDEIMSEVRAAREALAAEHGYDVSRLSAALEQQCRERMGKEDRAVLEPRPKRLDQASA
ncbi:MAG: hypothetical protein AAGI71_07955 [Bacteroidota bacterium]